MGILDIVEIHECELTGIMALPGGLEPDPDVENLIAVIQCQRLDRA